MDNLENIVSLFDYILNTKRKRHIVGGILMSFSLLFGGLALTVLTLKNETNDEDNAFNDSSDEQNNNYPKEKRNSFYEYEEE